MYHTCSIQHCQSLNNSVELDRLLGGQASHYFSQYIIRECDSCSQEWDSRSWESHFVELNLLPFPKIDVISHRVPCFFVLRLPHAFVTRKCMHACLVAVTLVPPATCLIVSSIVFRDIHSMHMKYYALLGIMCHSAIHAACI